MPESSARPWASTRPRSRPATEQRVAKTVGRTLSKLKDLATRAGKWLGLGSAAPAPPRATSAVVADRFDAMAWQEMYDQAEPLRELAEDLNEQYDYTTDLLRDVFLCAYKVAPQVRGRQEMDPSRLVNHQVITAMITSPEFEELHRETAGDPYAAAMAVLAQAAALRRILDQSRHASEEAQQTKAAEESAEEAARTVAEALQLATEAASDDGTVPTAEANAVGQAIGQAPPQHRRAQRAREKFGKQGDDGGRKAQSGSSSPSGASSGTTMVR